MEPTNVNRRGASNYDRLRTRRSLREAWASVRDNARTASEETRREVTSFRQEEDRNLRRIQDDLQKRRFTFRPGKGVPIPRPGKKPRPVVVSPVANRIVQRALLDELQRLPGTKKFVESEHSFGCVLRKSRADAIAAAQHALESGATWYIRSDICEFFTRVPRGNAVAELAKILDPVAAELLDAATEVELENAAKIDRALFPTEELGVAQGHCLSPLLGNVVLHDFDLAMNGGGVRCLRYVDDFLILGASRQGVLDAFDRAQCILNELGMVAYDPRADRDKADLGDTRRAFDFLGCSVQRGLVGPNKKSRQRIIGRVQEIVRNAEHNWSVPSEAHAKGASLQRVLYNVGNVLRGWRDSFAFCAQAFVFDGVDQAIAEEMHAFQRRFQRRYRSCAAVDQRLLLGLPVLNLASR
jgi:RNA-directed DNA polymerase